jgi:hypothetical protein
MVFRTCRWRPHSAAHLPAQWCLSSRGPLTQTRHGGALRLLFRALNRGAKLEAPNLQEHEVLPDLVLRAVRGSTSNRGAPQALPVAQALAGLTQVGRNSPEYVLQLLHFLHPGFECVGFNRGVC